MADGKQVMDSDGVFFIDSDGLRDICESCCVGIDETKWYWVRKFIYDTGEACPSGDVVAYEYIIQQGSQVVSNYGDWGTCDIAAGGSEETKVEFVEGPFDTMADAYKPAPDYLAPNTESWTGSKYFTYMHASPDSYGDPDDYLLQTYGVGGPATSFEEGSIYGQYYEFLEGPYDTKEGAIAALVDGGFTL